MAFRSALYVGTVMHHRRRAPVHRFVYPIYMHLLDLAELGDLEAGLRLFGWNRWRPVAHHDRDHLDGTPRPTVPRLRAVVEAAGEAWPGGRVLLLTHCRVFGYVFNPVSFFYCHRPDGTLALVVAEVNNTFGDRHPYVLPVRSAARDADGTRSVRYAWVHKKLMHVSPFFTLDGSYRFDLDVPGDRTCIRIDLTLGGQPLLNSALTLQRRELTDRALAGVLCRYPLMTAKVIGAIHWQALKLWLKGAPFHSQPPYDPELARRGAA